MLNNLRFFKYVQLLVSCFGLVACSGLSKKSFSVIQPLENPGAISMSLKSIPERLEVARYYSHSKIKAYESSQMVREKDEIVEFTVEARTLQNDKDNDLIHQLVTTIDKDGLVNLHDLAFPEVKERIEFVYKPNATVVYAGAYPESSVFYVPPLSLPEGPVNVGDTWEMQRSWVSLKNNIPLKLQLVTILKNIYPCPGGMGQCADLEVSGDVGIITALNEQTQFKSQISGRMIFALSTGSIIWSLVRSRESIAIGDTKMDVESCLISNMISPENEAWVGKGYELKCDPLVYEKLEVPRIPQITGLGSI